MSVTIMNLSYLMICIHFQKETHFSEKRLIFISFLIDKGTKKAASKTLCKEMVDDVTICLFLERGPCTAIGVSDDIHTVPDDQITASSHYLSYYSYEGRLNGTSGWCTGSHSDSVYLQIDMGVEYSVCAVATQGKPASYLESFILSFSTDGKNWSTYQEDGVDKVQ